MNGLFFSSFCGKNDGPIFGGLIFQDVDLDIDFARAAHRNTAPRDPINTTRATSTPAKNSLYHVSTWLYFWNRLRLYSWKLTESC